MTTRVVHCQKEAYDVYIGRDMPRYRLKDLGWGNPYKGDNAVSNYRGYLMMHPQLLARIPSLQGKVLGCWCKSTDPYANMFIDCHGDVLAELADADPLVRRIEWFIAVATQKHEWMQYSQILEQFNQDSRIDTVLAKLEGRLIIAKSYDNDGACFGHNPTLWLLEHPEPAKTQRRKRA